MPVISSLKDLVNQRLMASGFYEDVEAIPAQKGVTEHQILAKDRVFARRYLSSTNPYDAIELLRSGLNPLFSVRVKLPLVEPCLGYHGCMISHSGWFGLDACIDLNDAKHIELTSIPFDMAVSGIVQAIFSGATSISSIFHNNGLLQLRWVESLFLTTNKEYLRKTFVSAVSDIKHEESSFYYSSVFQVAYLMHMVGYSDIAGNYLDEVLCTSESLEQMVLGVDLLISRSAALNRKSIDVLFDSFLAHERFSFYSQDHLQRALLNIVSKCSDGCSLTSDLLRKVLEDFNTKDLLPFTFAAHNSLDKSDLHYVSNFVKVPDIDSLEQDQAISVLLSLTDLFSVDLLLKNDEFAFNRLVSKAMSSNKISSSSYIGILKSLGSIPLKGSRITPKAVDNLISFITDNVYAPYSERLSQNDYFYCFNELSSIATNVAKLITRDNDLAVIEKFLLSLNRDSLQSKFILNCNSGRMLLDLNRPEFKKLVLKSELDI